MSWWSVEEYLIQEGPVLLEMRVKQLMKEKQLGKAALLAKTCSEYPAFQGTGHFKQMYLVCLCATSEQNQLMDEVRVDYYRLFFYTTGTLHCLSIGVFHVKPLFLLICYLFANVSGSVERCLIS